MKTSSRRYTTSTKRVPRSDKDGGRIQNLP